MPTPISSSTELGGVGLVGGLSGLANTGDNTISLVVTGFIVLLGVLMLVSQIATKVIRRLYSG